MSRMRNKASVIEALRGWCEQEVIPGYQGHRGPGEDVGLYSKCNEGFKLWSDRI